MALTLTLTAAICTRDRAAWTAKAVQSLLDQDLPADRLDILVVDNGSTDDTASTVAAIAVEHPRVRYQLEPVPGLSHGRNRAIDVASGDVIAFLDDDAVADPGWARLHLAAFESDPAVLGTGGRIRLVWPDGRPEWLPAQREGMYAGLDLGDVEHDFVPPAIPYGANMAFRRSAFDTVAPFAVSLGRQGTGLLSGEERDLCERLRATGGRLVYLPDAGVDHHVLPNRADRSWLLRRCYDQGRSTVAMNHHRLGPRHRAYWVARAGYQAANALRWSGDAAVLRARRRSAAERTAAAARAAQAAGTARQSLRMARHPQG